MSPDLGKIRCATLNVNGFSSKPDKRLRMFTLLVKHKIDIAFVTEHHANVNNATKFEQEWATLSQGKAIFAPTDRTGAKGVAILFGHNLKKPQISNQRISVIGRSLSVEVKINQKTNKLLCTYAPNPPRERKQFVDQVNNEESSLLPVIWGGDFNFVEDPSLDRTGTPASYHTAGINQVRIFKNNHNLCDPFRIEYPNSRRFTYRGRPIASNDGLPFQSRIDRFYLPKRYLNKHSTLILPITDSDHDLVVCTFNPPSHGAKKVRGEGIWKFNTKYLQDVAFVRNIENAIDKFLPREESFDNIHKFWDALKSWFKIKSMDYIYQKSKSDKQALNKALKDLENESEKLIPDHTVINRLTEEIANFETN